MQFDNAADYLGFEEISTHSFRKWYAAEKYKANGYDIALFQRLLQNSSTAKHAEDLRVCKGTLLRTYEYFQKQKERGGIAPAPSLY